MTAVIPRPPTALDRPAPAPARAVPAVEATPQLLGIPIAAQTEHALLAAVERAVAHREPTVFVGLYAALFRSSDRNPRYRRLLQRSRVYPDGQGVVSELHRRGFTDAERVATTDLVHPLADRAAERGWRIGFYGGADGVAARAAENLRQQHPGVEVVAVWPGFGHSPGASELRAARLDVLFVGLGAGRQEHYAHAVAVAAGVPATMTCGGLFDFLSGDARRAPQWMQRAGLEWLFRVLREPRRMFTRYLRGNAYFLSATAAERRAQAALHGEHTPELPIGGPV